MSRTPLRNISERMETSQTCYATMQVRWAEYHEACAAFDWVRADRIRMILIETMEASLDATAAVFKTLDPKHGKETDVR